MITTGRLTAVLGAGLTTALLLSAGGALAEGDVEAGEKVFRKCKACHAVGEDAKNRVGPVLNGVVGAEIASNSDYKYSDAFLEKKEEGLVWDEKTLATYLEDPRDYIQNTKMSFAGLPKEEDRADVIAYLKSYE